MKIPLSNVTLIGVDTTRNARRTEDVLDYHQRFFDFGAVKFITDVGGKNDYNAVMDFERGQLGEHCPTEFQWYVSHDGFMLDPSLWHPEFLAFDMIGAPWPKVLSPRWAVGNTGFCIRSQRFLRLSGFFNGVQGRPGLAGDIFQCQLMRHAMMDHGMRYAPPEVAYRFSIENVMPDIPHCPHFGAHGSRALAYRDRF